MINFRVPDPLFTQNGRTKVIPSTSHIYLSSMLSRFSPLEFCLSRSLSNQREKAFFLLYFKITALSPLRDLGWTGRGPSPCRAWPSLRAPAPIAISASTSAGKQKARWGDRCSNLPPWVNYFFNYKHPTFLYLLHSNKIGRSRQHNAHHIPHKEGALAMLDTSGRKEVE